ncbi:hypothetical protein [Deinococcus sp. UYEF24]
MLASELATELGVDPSVITKRLGVYCAEKGIERTRNLDQQTITDMREVDRLLTDHTAPTVKVAVRKVLGTHLDPVPPDSVIELFNRLQAIETSQATTLRLVEQILEAIEGVRQRAEQRRQMEG